MSATSFLSGSTPTTLSKQVFPRRVRQLLEGIFEIVTGEMDRALANSLDGLEQELFKQVKRLADAERKLAVKETKTALNEQRIAGNKIKQMKRWIEDAKKLPPVIRY